ncbi:MAG TPA: hypothetical protein VNO75_12490 [Gemmatimonadaceae bacterium]|nr:hypothetical protein [Gemmatimonadaceae bacterium]
MRSFSTRRVRAIFSSAILGSSLLTVASCSPDAVTAPPAPNPLEAAATTAEGSLARSLALAFQDPGVRIQVRDAMRASPVDEHKLVLQTFVQSESGKAMLRAAAERSGVSVESLEAQIASLPELDFYMPIRAHRRSWEATGNILVVATLDLRGPFVGFTTSGNAMLLSGQKRDQLGPFFMLHPAEPKGRRVGAEAASSGSVIESPNDGNGSESLTLTLAGGRTVTIDLSDPNASKQIAEQIGATLSLDCDPMDPWQVETDPNCTPQGGGGPAPEDTTFLRAFEMDFCDDDACWTNNEIRLTAVYMTSTNHELLRATYRRGDVNPHQTYAPNVPLIFARIQEGSGEYMIMNLVEEDGGPGNNDDWCGDLNVTAAQNEGTIYYPNLGGGCTAQDNPPIYNYPWSAWVVSGWTPKP